MQRRVFVIGAAAGLLSGCTTVGVLGLSSSGANEIVTGQALPKVNRLRSGAGKATLVADSALGRSALIHAEYMARHGTMSHDNFAARMARAKIKLPAAENVAEGQRDVEGMFEAFVTSLHHRENMLGDKFRRLGVAVAHDGNERAYWVMQLSG